MAQIYSDLKNRMYVSANQFDLMLLRLALMVKKSYQPENIVVVERGGFAPLRRILDVFPDVPYDSLRVTHYLEDGVALDEPRIVKPLRYPEKVRDKKNLVLEECTDTGKTSMLVKNYLKELGAKDVRVGVLFHKYRSKFEPDWFVDRTDKWIYFWYETIESGRNLRNKGMSVDDVVAHFRDVGVPEEELEILIHFI
ncbi:MAG: phosphoribosyltransferase family protein [Candidatus Aenigmatarchaeota archaeon]